MKESTNKEGVYAQAVNELQRIQDSGWVDYSEANSERYTAQIEKLWKPVLTIAKSQRYKLSKQLPSLNNSGTIVEADDDILDVAINTIEKVKRNFKADGILANYVVRCIKMEMMSVTAENAGYTFKSRESVDPYVNQMKSGIRNADSLDALLDEGVDEDVPDFIKKEKLSNIDALSVSSIEYFEKHEAVKTAERYLSGMILNFMRSSTNSKRGNNKLYYFTLSYTEEVVHLFRECNLYDYNPKDVMRVINRNYMEFFTENGTSCVVPSDFTFVSLQRVCVIAPEKAKNKTERIDFKVKDRFLPAYVPIKFTEKDETRETPADDSTISQYRTRYMDLISQVASADC